METKKDNKTYYTLGGVVTKDTLSVEEWEKLDKKRQNDTLTKGESSQLQNDDSLSSFRSTSGMYHKDRVIYNPNVQYFMLDYQLKEKCRWVRIPYLTQFDLLNHLRNMVENFTDISNFRIHSEKELDRKFDVECKDGETRNMTLRQILFDERYEKCSQMVKDPKSSYLMEINTMRDKREL